MVRFALVIVAAGSLLGTACTHTIKVEPVEVEVKPIHMTVDINLKVDRALDDFFGFEDETQAPDAGGAEGG